MYLAHHELERVIIIVLIIIIIIIIIVVIIIVITKHAFIRMKLPFLILCLPYWVAPGVID